MWPLIIGSTAAYALWKLLSKPSAPAQTNLAANAPASPLIPPTFKVNDTVMVKTASLGLPRAMPTDGETDDALVSPPDLLPAKIYGVNGSSFNAKIATKGGLAYPQFWDGDDIAFKASIVDGFAKDSKYAVANQGLAL